MSSLLRAVLSTSRQASAVARPNAFSARPGLVSTFCRSASSSSSDGSDKGSSTKKAQKSASDSETTTAAAAGMDAPSGDDEVNLEEMDELLEQTMSEEDSEASLIENFHHCSNFSVDLQHVYHLVPDIYERVPECGESKLMYDEFEHVGRAAIMLRKQTQQIVKNMKAWSEKETRGKNKPVLLEGEEGSGKTASLLHIVHWARENGWIVMYEPDPAKYIHADTAVFYGTLTGAAITESSNYSGLYGQPQGAMNILEIMKEIHGEQLSKLPMKREYDHSLYNKEGGSTLLDIVNKGLTSLRFSSDAVYDLRLELSKVTDVPVLVAVDNFNKLYWPTCFHIEHERLEGDKLQLSNMLRILNKDGSVNPELELENGFIVTGCSKSKIAPKYFKKNKIEHHAPFTRKGDLLDIVAKREAKSIDVRVVENYDEDEFELALLTYDLLATVPRGDKELDAASEEYAVRPTPSNSNVRSWGDEKDEMEEYFEFLKDGIKEKQYGKFNDSKVPPRTNYQAAKLVTRKNPRKVFKQMSTLIPFGPV